MQEVESLQRNKYLEKYKVPENVFKYSNGVFVLQYLPSLHVHVEVSKTTETEV